MDCHSRNGRETDNISRMQHIETIPSQQGIIRKNER